MSAISVGNLAALFSLLVCSCAPTTFLAHPDLSVRTSRLKRIVVLPPQINLYETEINGVRERIGEWSQKGTRNFVTALQSEFERRQGAHFRILGLESMSETQKSELSDIQGLFTAINLNVLWHVYGVETERFIEIVQDFNFSFGTDNQRLDLGDADAYLLVNGLDHISSSGRLSVEFIRSVLGGPLGLALNPPKLGQSWVSLALVDAFSGELLWYRIEQAFGSEDLRDPNSAISLTQKLLTAFPIP